MCMDDKEILRRVIQGFQLVPAKQGFGNPYVTKTGAATSDLSKRINAWIKQNFPQSNIMTSYEGVYKTINFRRVMAEHLIVKQLVRETIEEARSQSATRKVRDEIVALSPELIKPAQTPNRIFAPELSTKEIVEMIEQKYNTSVREIAAKDEDNGSESSKFPTLEFKVGSDIIKIVHAKGIIAGAEGEVKQTGNIQDQLKDKKITLKIGNESYTDVDGFRKVGGNKKADFAFTSGDKDIVYVQHKSLAHQQMSGIKKFQNTDGTYKFPEIGELVERTRKETQNGEIRLTSKITVPIKSPELKKLAVYGYPESKKDANFVEAYCIGDMQLEDLGNNTYELTAPTIYTYDQVPEDGNTPTLVATYRKGRTQDGIQNVRFGIYPESYAK
jgi:hypothetical protein